MSGAGPSDTTGLANLDVFSMTLQDLASQNRDIVIVTSDSRISGRLLPFAEKFPEQVVEVGIAEQNLVGVSAGLAACGKQVYAVSPASFLTTRSLEQIKNDVCYSDNPVTLVGISAGVSYGPLGSTHHSLSDFASLRAIHNVVVVAPADNYETAEAVRACARAERPVYLRFGKAPIPHVHSDSVPFEFGKGIRIREGSDVGFVATGETVACAVAASEMLASRGLSAQVVSMHTVRPLDLELLLDVASSVRALIVVEEHSVHGGLGEACAGALAQARESVNAIHLVGFPDEPTMNGTQLDLFRHYGLDAAGLARTATEMITA